MCSSSVEFQKKKQFLMFLKYFNKKICEFKVVNELLWFRGGLYFIKFWGEVIFLISLQSNSFRQINFCRIFFHKADSAKTIMLSSYTYVLARKYAQNKSYTISFKLINIATTPHVCSINIKSDYIISPEFNEFMYVAFLCCYICM